MTTNTFGGSYQHTQKGKFIVLPVLMTAIAFAAGVFIKNQPLFLIAVPILLVAAWLFRSLTVEITERELRWHFGTSLIHKSVPLSEILSVKPVKTRFLEGWGIHWSRFGWLYNVSGFDAVAISLRSGKRFALGTNESLALLARLREALQRNGADTFKA